MSLINKCFVIIASAFLFTACRKHQNIFRIDLNRNDVVSIKKVFSKIELIPLENTKGLPIKRVNKVISYDNRFYVLDIANYRLLIFDNLGKFIFKIQTLTKSGLGNYEMIRDFEVNHFNNTLELLSPDGRIFVYDLNGTFKRNFSIPDVRAVQYLKSLGSDTIVFYAMFEKERLAYYSRRQNRIIKKAFEVSPFITRSTPLNNVNSPFVSNQNEIDLSTAFSKSVYKLEKDNIELKYRWDFGKFDFDVDTLSQGKTRKFYMDFFNRKNRFVTNIFYNIESNGDIFTGFLFDGKKINLIYHKDSNTYNVFEKFSENISIPVFTVPFEKGLMANVESGNLNRAVTPELLDSNGRSLLKNVKPTDNPFIVKYYFKTK